MCFNFIIDEIDNGLEYYIWGEFYFLDGCGFERIIVGD